MTLLSFIIQIVALICLFAAAYNVTWARAQLGWLGLALWLLSLMVTGVVLHPVGP